MMNTGAKRIYGANEWLNLALNLARGSYQRGILRGQETISGSSLRGRAASYKRHYLASTSALLDRLRAAGVPFRVVPRAGNVAAHIEFFASPVSRS